MPKKVLILDDDVDIARLLEVLLKNKGYIVITADSGKIFDELLTINPDLILMDNTLGDGFGKDYCRQIKTDPATAHFKIVLVSAAADLASIAGDSFADAFLAKPFDLGVLIGLAEQLTANP